MTTLLGQEEGSLFRIRFEHRQVAATERDTDIVGLYPVSRFDSRESRERALVASNANLIKRINHFNVTRRHVATERRGDEAKGVERDVGEIGREGVEQRKRKRERET